jgi:2-phosphosulfolactate phosphatase
VKLSVFFTPLGLESSFVSGKPVLVLDILRTTTTIVTALANGARAVIPAANGAEALELARTLSRDDLLLSGERGYQMIDGFDLGNSPREMTPEVVDGKTIVMATTNGTEAVQSADAGAPVFIGSILNFAAAARAARSAFEETGELVILCAGHERRFALEDAYVAGRFAKAVLPGRLKKEHGLNDAAIAARELVRHYGDEWTKAIEASAAAKNLKTFKLKEDIAAVTRADQFDVVPRYFERQIRIDHQE